MIELHFLVFVNIRLKPNTVLALLAVVFVWYLVKISYVS